MKCSKTATIAFFGVVEETLCFAQKPKLISFQQTFLKALLKQFGHHLGHLQYRCVFTGLHQCWEVNEN